MKLVVGGYSQGKLDYVLKDKELTNFCIMNGELPNAMQVQQAKTEGRIVVINHFHTWIRTCILQEKNPEEEIMDFVNNTPECILISDEIGNGIVPMEAFEREYRERTGRILVKLAEQADKVVRVICGIGQIIK